MFIPRVQRPTTNTMTVSVLTRAGSPRHTPRRGVRVVLLLLGALLFSGLVNAANAAHAPAKPRVVWAHGAIVYVAPTDSAAIAIGDHLWLLENGSVIASGTVSRVDTGGLALAVLETGSLDPVKRLDRVDVTV